MRISNAKFAKTDPIFREACRLAKIAEETIDKQKRQASKFHRGKGMVYRFFHEARELLKIALSNVKRRSDA